MTNSSKPVYDYIIIGSGFGGSVSALRLSEKGYKVLVIEKGKKYKTDDFPKSNWNLRKWLWLPTLRFYGFFKITFYRHVGILSGVGVGGGSLVYANTLPIPKKDFFSTGSWAKITNWEKELKPYYYKAKTMLGAAKNPREEFGDKILKEIAASQNLSDHFELTDVGIYFGDPEKEVEDPYFKGEGPRREGCRFCGGCMVGCRYNAKNTLDKNYLYLAANLGAEIKAESEVYDIIDTSEGYEVFWKSSTKIIKQRGKITANGIIFAGGVLGTVPLLLKLKNKQLPNLSEQVGKSIRTNNESLLGVVSPETDKNFSDGIAISSIFHTDEHSHIEPVRYPSGSGFWRFQMLPMIEGNNILSRLLNIISELIKHPTKWSKAFFVRDWASKTQILLYMRTLEDTLTFEKGMFRVKSKIEKGKAPTANIPESRKLAGEFANKTDGVAGALISDMLLGVPTTAHILGGAVIGENVSEGVIDKNHKVFGYKNMFIVDGSAVPANPGVNPSLTITAMAERAIDKIPAKISKTKTLQEIYNNIPNAALTPNKSFEL